MSNSHDLIFQSNLEGNKYDVTPDKNMRNTTVKDEKDRQNWLKNYKQNVYEKMKAFPEKIANGESIAIIQFQYDYLCNMDCEHCCIDKFYVPRDWEKASGRRKFEMEDVSGEMLTKVKRNNKIMIEFKGSSTISRTD